MLNLDGRSRTPNQGRDRTSSWVKDIIKKIIIISKQNGKKTGLRICLYGEHFPGMCETPGLIPGTAKLVKKKLNLQPSTLEARLTQVGAGSVCTGGSGPGCQLKRLY